MPDNESADRDIWQAVRWTDEGLSITTFSQVGECEPVTEAEADWTWQELAAKLSPVYVLEQAADGDPEHLVPVGAFTDFTSMDALVSQHDDGSAEWRWTEHELDEFTDVDDASDDSDGEGESAPLQPR